MPVDMREETLRHQANWRGFVTFLGAAAVGIVIVLGALALTLL